MPSFIALITSRLAGPVLGVLALVSLLGNLSLGIGLKLEKSHSAKLETRVEELAADNSTLKVSNANLKGSVATQNAGVASIKSAADIAAAGAKAGQAAHEGAASAHDAKAAAIHGAQPTPGTDLCAAASELIRTTLSGEKVQ